jgi:hypothetical protein
VSGAWKRHSQRRGEAQTIAYLEVIEFTDKASAVARRSGTDMAVEGISGPE